MKKKIEMVVCDNCKKEIKENVIIVLKKDFCSVECLVEWVEKPHKKRCHECGGSGYTYWGGGYGDNDERCTFCTDGTEPMTVKEAFMTEETGVK
jgi:hypothetical protein